MTSFISFLTKQKFPKREQIKSLLEGPFTWNVFIFYTLVILCIVTFYIFLIQLNNKFLISVPARGGSVTEGIIGSPRFINPILMATENDEALVNLIYAGLYRKTQSGEVVPELARTTTVSPDGKTYTIELQDTLFHDKKPLTAKDILFTVSILQDENISANASYWQNISIEETGPTTVTFNLPKPDEMFLHNLTFGIIPKHIWEDVPREAFAQFSNKHTPVGAGPFKVRRLVRKDGFISSIRLVRNNNYVDGKPLLKKITIDVFANENSLHDAIVDEDIDMTMSLSPTLLGDITSLKNYSVTKVSTQKPVGLYHTSNDNVFSNASFVNILHAYVDKNAILDKVENGYGTPHTVSMTSEAQRSLEETLASLRSIGYTYTNGSLNINGSPVGFSMSVQNDPQSLLAAQTLAEDLGSLGMIVSIKAFDPGTFQDEVQKARSNIVLVRGDTKVLPQTYRQAFMLYDMSIPYVIRKDVRGVVPETLEDPRARYENIQYWYTEIDKIWKWIANTNKQ